MRWDNLVHQIRPFQNGRILLDTNLLIVYVVGQTSIELIDKHRRTKKTYTNIDYLNICRIVSCFQGMITTPYILSETSNLLENDSAYSRSTLSCLKNLIENNFLETFHGSKQVVQSNLFSAHGLSDSFSLQLIEQGVFCLSVDLDFIGPLTSKYLNAVNFNHWRI